MSFQSLFLCVAFSVMQDPILDGALERAGDNRVQLEGALGRLEGEEHEGLSFLLRHMSDGDLTSLSSDYLVEHVTYAYRAWREAPWSSAMPEQYFLENVLPHASINERRDAWRADFYERFRPLVAYATSPSEAAAILNQKMFEQVGVRYSTERPKADQSPYESMEAGLASCTGLSVLLIDACRSVGVPARFVGVPSWSDDSGNHSWVEIWDNGWHFTGAAEPTGSELDKAWFTGRASNARANSEKYGIFAVSFVKTGQRLPMVWKPEADEVHAVDVTHRYTATPEVVPEGFVRVRFQALTIGGRKRCAASVKVSEPGSKGVIAATKGIYLFEGQTRDESFDANDYLTAHLPEDEDFIVTASFDWGDIISRLSTRGPEQLVLFEVPELVDAEKAKLIEGESWAAHEARVREQQAAQMEARVMTDGKHEMPFWYSVNGEAPEGGRSLWISMHGGGGAPAEVNYQQWENQKKLYEIPEGVYVAPRAPTDTWNLWHEGHIDTLFDQLIQNMADLREADPQGYDHWVEIHEGKGHWMDRGDAAALPWMAERTRNSRPDRIVWLQSSRTHRRFYWLAVDEPIPGSRVVVEREGQEIRILEAEGVERLTIRLDDTMLDLDREVTFMLGDKLLFARKIPRSRSVIEKTLAERGDPTGIYTAEISARRLAVWATASASRPR